MGESEFVKIDAPDDEWEKDLDFLLSVSAAQLGKLPLEVCRPDGFPLDKWEMAEVGGVKTHTVKLGMRTNPNDASDRAWWALYAGDPVWMRCELSWVAPK